MTENLIPRTLYVGCFMHSPTSLQKLEILPCAIVAVSEEGLIIDIIELASRENPLESSEFRKTTAERGWELSGTKPKVVIAKPGEWFMPGFVDSHTHACQFPTMGVGQSLELLTWLKEVIYPGELAFSDIEVANTVYPSVVERTINSGTTTCCYYGSIHTAATKILADVVNISGQRAVIGKCNIDRNSLNPDYVETTNDSFESTKELIEYIRQLHDGTSPLPPLVYPALTPRFALSCTPELLGKIGQLADNDKSLHIQTHISENRDEVRETLKAFPGFPSLAAIYDHFGILSERTILAHGCWVQDEELKLIKERGAGISHCPTSNFNLRSGFARAAEMMRIGVKVGLGTDVAGGSSPSILTVIRDANNASKVLEFFPPPHPGFTLSPLSIEELFYLATLGGAEVCSFDHIVGNFMPHKEFDALLVSVRPETNNPDVWFKENDKPEDMLERFFLCGDDRNIRSVWVRGRQIGGVDKH